MDINQKILSSIVFPDVLTKAFFECLVFFSSEIDNYILPGRVHQASLQAFNNCFKVSIDEGMAISIVDQLSGIKLDWEIVEKKWTGYTKPISRCLYDEERKVISWTFDPMFIEACFGS